jgi:hypothetical protein
MIAQALFLLMIRFIDALPPRFGRKSHISWPVMLLLWAGVCQSFSRDGAPAAQTFLIDFGQIIK